MLKIDNNKQEDDLTAANMLLSLGNNMQEGKLKTSKILKPHPKFRVKVCRLVLLKASMYLIFFLIKGKQLSRILN
jgi:hypothetical protein